MPPLIALDETAQPRCLNQHSGRGAPVALANVAYSRNIYCLATRGLKDRLTFFGLIARARRTQDDLVIVPRLGSNLIRAVVRIFRATRNLALGEESNRPGLLQVVPEPARREVTSRRISLLGWTNQSQRNEGNDFPRSDASQGGIEWGRRNASVDSLVRKSQQLTASWQRIGAGTGHFKL